MVDPVVVGRDLLVLFFILIPNDEVVPPLKVMAGSFGNVHALYGLACLHGMMSIDNPELAILNIFPQRRALGCLEHDTKCLTCGLVEHVNAVVSRLLHNMFVRADSPFEVSSFHLLNVDLVLHIHTKNKAGLQFCPKLLIQVGNLSVVYFFARL